MADSDASTAVYIGNLKHSARIGELKLSIHKLINKVLQVHITPNDISLINGTKRYAIVDVHNYQNVDFLLESLSNPEDREKIRFNFQHLTDNGVLLHVDKVKSQDEKQAKTDFENAKNLRPYQKPHRLRRIQPDFGRVMSVKSSKSSASTNGGRSSRQSTSTKVPSDLDVTIEEDEHEVEDQIGSVPKVASGSPQEDGELLNKHIHMVPVGDVTLQGDSDDSQNETSLQNHTLSTIEADDECDNKSLNSEFEDPPGSVIDLRNVSRAALISRASNIATPKRSRVSSSLSRTSSRRVTEREKSAKRRDFFASLDRQIGLSSSDSEIDLSSSIKHVDDANTPYYKRGECVYNDDKSKEFKDYSDEEYTLKKVRDHVCRCVCGFLNSGEKGMLLLGVDREGVVNGIQCDSSQEEKYRRQFLEGLKEIYPPVFMEDFSINFSPLLEDNGRQHPSSCAVG